MAGLDTILKAADLISEVRRAFGKIEKLEQAERQIADALVRLDHRIMELETGLREARSELKLEAIRETQNIVNSVQSQFHQELRGLCVQVDRLASRSLPIERETMKLPSQE